MGKPLSQSILALSFFRRINQMQIDYGSWSLTQGDRLQVAVG
jgi:hypothetical protein